jgi:hypothetical protein
MPRLETHADAPKVRLWIRRVMLLCATLVVSMLGAEMAMWGLGIYPPIIWSYTGERADRGHVYFESDPTVGWRMRPAANFTLGSGDEAISFRSDVNGYRISDAQSSSLTSHTIVMAGDSFFWGAEVEYDDSIAALLDIEYPATRIKNISQPGFGLDQVMLSVEKHGLSLKPDLVIVGIYPHDLSRSHTAYREDLGFNKPTFQLEGQRLVRQTAADRPSALGALIEHHSRLLGLWRRAQRYVGFNHGVGSWWWLNAAILDRLRASVAAAGSSLLLVHVPLRDWRPFVGLSSYCELHGVALIDPVAADSVKPIGIYIEPDGHFTPRGQRYLFDMIATWIDSQEDLGLR